MQQKFSKMPYFFQFLKKKIWHLNGVHKRYLLFLEIEMLNKNLILHFVLEMVYKGLHR